MKKTLVCSFLGLFLVAFVAGCDVIARLNSYQLEVVNLCLGSNRTVNFYMNGAFKGQIYLRRSFDVLAGQYELYAEGTGAGAASASRSAYIDRDLQWVLCPESALLNPQQHPLENALQTEF